MPTSTTQFWPYQAVYSWSRTDGTLSDQSRLWLNALYRTVSANGGGGVGPQGPPGPQGDPGRSVLVTEDAVAPADPVQGDIWIQRIETPVVPPDEAHIKVAFDALHTTDLAAWTNPYGDGWSIVANGANPMPTLDATGLHFDGVSQACRLSGPIAATIPTQATVYLAFVVGAQPYTILSNGRGEWTSYYGGVLYASLLQSARHDSYRSDMPDTGTARHVVAYLADATSYQVNLDAVPGTLTTPAGAYLPDPLGGYWTMGVAAEGYGQFNGTVAAVLIYDTVHDATTQSAVRTYLATQLGIAGTVELIPYVWDGAEWALMEGTEGPAGPQGPPGVPGADGSVIWSGTGLPDVALGAIGDYYIDTDTDTMYGPKQDALGAPVSMMPSLTPATPAANSSGFVLGSEFTVNAVGEITALRFWRSSSSALTSRTLKLWLGSTLVASAQPTTETAGQSGWIEAPLASPRSTAVGEDYTVSYDEPSGGHFAYDATLASSESPELTWVRGLFGYSGYPNTDGGSNYCADVVFRAAGNVWPVAIAPPTFAGDLSGTNTSQTVIGLQTRPVAATAPTDTQVLTWVAADGMWEPKAAAAPAAIRETPAGTLNGTNTTFTLSFAPNPAASLTLWLNGVEQVLTTDYTISSTTITYVVAPKSSDLMVAQYTH